MDPSIQAYAEAHTTPEPGVLAALNRETHLTQVCPQMLSGHLQGSFLRMVAAMLQPRRVLEIGTFTGYSALALGSGMVLEASDSPRLHTIEANPELEDTIRKYIREAGLDKEIVLHIGQAAEIIPTLEETWDLVFIDADKPGYAGYYDLVLPRLRKGGIILADNVLWDGKVTGDPEKMDRDTRGIHAFNTLVQADPRVENVLLPIRDGLMVIRKI